MDNPSYPRWKYNSYILRCAFKFEREKSREVKRKHGVSLYEAQEIFDQVHIATKRATIRNSSEPLVGAPAVFAP